MWVFTVDGFYSAVENEFCKDGELAIRARSKEDLLRMMKRLDYKASIMSFAEADYRYRIHLPRQVWGDYLAQSATDLHYSNFKNACKRAGASPNMLRALHQCWAALYSVQ